MLQIQYILAWFATRIPRSERGQDLAEYGMLIGLIALILVVAVTLLGVNLATVFTQIAGKVGPWGAGG